MIQNASFASVEIGVFVGWGKFYGEIIIYESKKVNALFARGKGGVGLW